MQVKLTLKPKALAQLSSVEITASSTPQKT